MIIYNDNNELIGEDDNKILKNLASPSMLSTGSVMLAGLGGAGPLSFPEHRGIDGDDDDHDDDDNDDDDHDDGIDGDNAVDRPTQLFYIWILILVNIQI